MLAKIGGWILEWEEAAVIAKLMRLDLAPERLQPDNILGAILSVIYKRVEDDGQHVHFYPEAFIFGGREVMLLVTRGIRKTGT
jgi:hypothetical protein